MTTLVEHRIVSKRHSAPHASDDVLVQCACGWSAQGPERDVMAGHAEHVEIAAGAPAPPTLPRSAFVGFAVHAKPDTDTEPRIPAPFPGPLGGTLAAARVYARRAVCGDEHEDAYYEEPVSAVFELVLKAYLAGSFQLGADVADESVRDVLQHGANINRSLAAADISSLLPPPPPRDQRVFVSGELRAHADTIAEMSKVVKTLGAPVDLLDRMGAVVAELHAIAGHLFHPHPGSHS